jgi:tryptophan-rich hypothetical protein
METTLKQMINPKKLLNSKWTAVLPVNKEKHFLVSKVMLSECNDSLIEFVEIEAIHSQRKQVIAWRSLLENTVWLQGWK